MNTIPVKVKKRFTEGLKKYKPVLTRAEKQDFNESDTVTIITDMLADIFGYDKYDEITSELAIKKTFCDLAIKHDDIVKLLIEVKSIGTNLKDNHLKQATDYGANSGIEWVILTNGAIWKVYRIIFSKPIEHELVYEFNIHDIKASDPEDLEYLFMLSKESICKNASTLNEYHSQKQLLNAAMISQILLCDDVTNAIKRVLKKISADTKVNNEEIVTLLKNEVIKRDALEDERLAEYKRKVNKATKKTPKVEKTKDS